MSAYDIRVLSGMDEFLAAEALQRIVWGEEDTEDPGDLMMVIQHEGGLVAGAFAGDELMGYVFGFPTRDPGAQHSHRLAVHPAARGAGLAARLKWFQRAWCLAHGITLVRWTFDPLRHTNAHLNIGRLGARVSTYYADYYGEMKGINAGLPSDRLLAEWHLEDTRVGLLAQAEGRQETPPPGNITHEVPIPRSYEELLASGHAPALAERMRVRDALQSLFSSGHEIRGYDPAAGAYLLGPRSDTEPP
jgi:predicted GNAT superfamily acetyltransferase